MSMGASHSGLLSQKGQVRLLLRLGYFAGATTAKAAVPSFVGRPSSKELRMSFAYSFSHKWFHAGNQFSPKKSLRK
jgi:hypothetical protein